ncbi:hypothetical protein AX16_000373 [Volvariella volvacea WC 439]|nr:hypothetical protein AX16_000373 [Volvariella volvacea WC 439]
MTSSQGTAPMEAPKLYKGGCFCGAVSYQVTGPPILRAYCHCTVCQRINASALIHTVHFPVDCFTWTHRDSPEAAEAVLDPYVVHHKPWKKRWRCKNCGSAVASHNSKANKISVWGAQLERDGDGRIKHWEELKPTAHIFYGTRMLDVSDDLGKWEGYENESRRLG